MAIFQELQVNRALYFLVFGESLLNGISTNIFQKWFIFLKIIIFLDAVVIVLHHLMSAFVTVEIVTARDVIKGFISFFLISGGGLAVGIIFGVLTAIITLHTTNVRG